MNLPQFPIEPDEDPEDPGEFYCEALPCESCGKPAEYLEPAYWGNLLVGPCCAVHSDDYPEIMSETPCEALGRAVAKCKSVAAVVEAFDAHRLVCAVCRNAGIERIEPGRAGEVERKREAA